MSWYEKNYLEVGDRQVKKISDDGVRKSYWTSTPYVHCRPVPGAPEPVWIREEGRVAAIVVWEVTNVKFFTEAEAAENDEEDEDIDFNQLFSDVDFFESFADEYDGDFCDGERGEE